jgi:hypothetical protein
VTVSTTSVSELPLGGTNDFFNLLTSSVWAQNGWTFNKAQPVESLTGRFDIGVYAPFFLTDQETVGAEIQVLYSPGVGLDPVGSNVHFIQRVVNNHAYTVTRQGVIEQPPGTPDDKIDTVLEQTQPGFIDPQKPTFNPFYDTYGRVIRGPDQGFFLWILHLEKISIITTKTGVQNFILLRSKIPLITQLK